MTIKDISRELGVSVSTISKALNGKKGVSDMLRKKILYFAEKYDYEPNSLAVSLVKKETNKIALFIISKESQTVEERFSILWTELLTYLLEEVYKVKHHLIIFKLNYLDHQKNYLELCKSENVKGAIFSGLMNNDNQIEELKKFDKFPIVVFDNNFGGKLNSVKTDNYNGIKQLTEFIKSCVKKEDIIGYISGEDTAQVNLEREEALKNNLSKYQLKKYMGNFTKLSGYEGAKYLIGVCGISHIVCFNDSMALGVFDYCKEHNLTIPDDVHIVGFDNILISEIINPQLTTVGHDLIHISKKIVSLILSQNYGKNILIKPNFYKRKSF